MALGLASFLLHDFLASLGFLLAGLSRHTAILRGRIAWRQSGSLDLLHLADRGLRIVGDAGSIQPDLSAHSIPLAIRARLVLIGGTSNSVLPRCDQVGLFMGPNLPISCLQPLNFFSFLFRQALLIDRTMCFTGSDELVV